MWQGRRGSGRGEDEWRGGMERRREKVDMARREKGGRGEGVGEKVDKEGRERRETVDMASRERRESGCGKRGTVLM